LGWFENDIVVELILKVSNDLPDINLYYFSSTIEKVIALLLDDMSFEKKLNKI
jgi:hypothetical protein